MKTLRLVSLIFGVIGVVFLGVAAVVAYGQSGPRAGWKTAQGEVIGHAYERDRDGDGGYRTVVRFSTEDGRVVEVKSRVRTSWRALDVGAAAPVDYHSGSPDDARIATATERWFLPGIFGLLGGIFVAVGGGIGAWQGVVARREEKLRSTGERYVAEVLGVSRNPRMRFNRQDAWRVEAGWSDPLTGEKRVARSRNLDFDPAPYLGAQIDVFVDRTDGRKVLVDLSGIEAVAWGGFDED